MEAAYPYVDEDWQSSLHSSPAGGSPLIHFAIEMDETLEGISNTTANMRIPGSHEASTLLPHSSSFGSLPRQLSFKSGSLTREEQLLSSSYLSECHGEEAVHKIVITGGPCAGKTTAIARVRGYLLDSGGLRVFTVPDAAKLLFEHGASFEDMGCSEAKIEFQVQVLKMQIYLEQTFEDLARATRLPSILICDRGLMDGQCFVTDEEWNRVLDRQNLSTVEARDQRYTAVFHLMSAADGAEHFYQEKERRYHNNTRFPSLEEARDFDNRCQAVWTGHPRFTVIANRPGQNFEGKLSDLVCGVAQQVGIQVPREKKFKKYRLQKEPAIEDFPEFIPVEHFEVEKVYLTPSQIERGTYSFVRRRSQGSHASYTRTTCVSSAGETIEMKKIISATEYAENVAERADPSRRTVRQRRMTFLYQQTHYEIYIYSKPCPGLSLLLVQVFADDASPPLPDFLPILDEVTGQSEYSAYHLSIQPPDADADQLMSPRTKPLSEPSNSHLDFDTAPEDGFAL